MENIKNTRIYKSVAGQYIEVFMFIPFMLGSGVVFLGINTAKNIWRKINSKLQSL